MRTSFVPLSRAAVGCGAVLLLALAGCGTASSGGAGGGVTSTRSGPTVTASSGPAGGASGPASGASGSASAVATAPATTPPVTPGGGPVPKGFAATSVTFVSADEAFVLGTAPCAVKPCTSIVRTMDRGGSWRGLPAPVVRLGQPENTSGPAVWGIRFASPEHGFVFGNELWETTDGGEHWTSVATPASAISNSAGSILSLEVIDGQVLAVTTSCNPANGSDCSQVADLMRRDVPGGPWHLVRSALVRSSVDLSELISTQGRVAALLDRTSVLVSADGGRTTAEHATPCDKEGTAVAQAVAVTGPASLALLCSTDNGAAGSMGKSVYLSGDLGAHWSRAAAPPFAGDPWSIAGGTPTRLVVSAFSGASWLYLSADAAGHWSTSVQQPDGGSGWNDLGFTTTSDGVVVSGPAITDGNAEGRPGQLLLSGDGGATWHAVTF